MASNCDDLIKRLSNAKDALERVMTGQQARVVVDQNGEKVEFSAINLPRLQAYIGSLENQLAACMGCGSSTPNAPLRFFY